MSVIYHVTAAAEWDAAKMNGAYEASSLPIEGFIHCSTESQLEGVLERYFAGQTNLVKLIIDPQKLLSKLQFDRSEAMNEDFPHIYGPINLDAVTEVETIQ